MMVGPVREEGVARSGRSQSLLLSGDGSRRSGMADFIEAAIVLALSNYFLNFLIVGLLFSIIAIARAQISLSRYSGRCRYGSTVATDIPRRSGTVIRLALAATAKASEADFVPGFSRRPRRRGKSCRRARLKAMHGADPARPASNISIRHAVWQGRRQIC